MKLRKFLSRISGHTPVSKVAEKHTATEFFEHKYSRYTVGLPAELEGLEPLNDTCLEKTKFGQAWWSSVHDAVRPPIKNLTIFSALEAKRHAKKNPDWERRVTGGCEQMKGAGYASCNKLELPGLTGMYFTSRGDSKLNSSRFVLHAGGEGGVLNISLEGDVNDHDRLEEIMDDIIANIRLKE